MFMWNLNVYMESFSRFNNVIGPQFTFQSANAVLLGLTNLAQSCSIVLQLPQSKRAWQLEVMQETAPIFIWWPQLPKPQLKLFNAKYGDFSLRSYSPKVWSTPGSCRITFISLQLSHFHTDLVFSQVDFQYGKKRAPKNTAS